MQNLNKMRIKPKKNVFISNEVHLKYNFKTINRYKEVKSLRGNYYICKVQQLII